MKLASGLGQCSPGLRLRCSLLIAVICSWTPLAQARLAARSHMALRARTKGIFWNYDAIISAATCECSCCVVEPRRPAEADGGAVDKCVSPSEERRKESCATLCATVGDQVLESAPVVSLERFCFYKCKPEGPYQQPGQGAQDASDETDTPCVGLTGDEETQNLATDGNGRDGQLQSR
mmetsp:Transcript_53448/g.98860  ORF Transcript_53448/g.98860 Transcript_53448/m.98860 type:complete len:178 (-) Transcript_53448:77-610(-)